jgi:hypothetical protein
VRGLDRVAVFLAVIAVISWAMVVLSVAQTQTLPSTPGRAPVAAPATK